LQDIHWYDGAWGYFPTYTLGAMAASQLFVAAKVAYPDIPEMISRGDFRRLVGWMQNNIHAKGSSGATDDILLAATGKPLGTDDFKAHLQERYG
ncbi:MAG: carboxypeptidase M32, partial [Pseudomonadota bacterium]|nr:carboxypeptidase M32 [Pseudomonadota bacterium]